MILIPLNLLALGSEPLLKRMVYFQMRVYSDDVPRQYAKDHLSQSPGTNVLKWYQTYPLHIKGFNAGYINISLRLKQVESRYTGISEDFLLSAATVNFCDTWINAQSANFHVRLLYQHQSREPIQCTIMYGQQFSYRYKLFSAITCKLKSLFFFVGWVLPT